MTWRNDGNLSQHGILITSDTKKIPLGKTNNDYFIFKIPLNKLKYNSSNGRIFMEMAKLKTNGDIDIKSLEENNPSQFNDEIEKLIWETSIEKNNITLKDIERNTQLESGVVLDDGTVIDGNRRFTCLRRLNKEFPDNIEYKYFKAAIIFRDGVNILPKDIKRYELKVQFGRDEKVDYKAVNFAMSIYQEVLNKTFTIQEIAENVNKKTSEIVKIVQTSELVDEFLSYTGRQKQYYVAEELNIYWPLEPLASYLFGAEGSKLTEIELKKRKFLYFDFLVSIDAALPTQEFRDNLIKKIFKDTVLCEELITEYHDNEGEQINKKLIKNKQNPEDFVKTVRQFRKNDETAASLLKRYKNKIDKKNLQNQVNAPVELCQEILDRLAQINIKPFLSATSKQADQKLKEILVKLTNSKELIEQINEEINKKLTFND